MAEIVNNTVVFPMEELEEIDGMLSWFMHKHEDGRVVRLRYSDNDWDQDEVVVAYLMSKYDFDNIINPKWWDVGRKDIEKEMRYAHSYNAYRCNIDDKTYFALSYGDSWSYLNNAMWIFEGFTQKETTQEDITRGDINVLVNTINANLENVSIGIWKNFKKLNLPAIESKTGRHDYYFEEQHEMYQEMMRIAFPKCEICSCSLYKIEVVRPYADWNKWRNMAFSRHITEKQLTKLRTNLPFERRYHEITICKNELCLKKAKEHIKNHIRKEVEEWLNKKRIQKCQKLLSKTRRALRKNDLDACRSLQKEYKQVKTSPNSCLV